VPGKGFLFRFLRSRAKPQPPAPDKITVARVGAGSAIAAGRGARAILNQITVNFPNVKWLPVVVALLLIIGVMAALFWQFILRKPARMQGLFNVAVAGFTVTDADGNSIPSQDGYRLADLMVKQIDQDFKQIELAKSIQYELWGPQETGQVNGSTPEQRASNANALAQKIDAQVLIYGVIQVNGDSASFYPEFYVNYNGFQGGEEITGQNLLGSAIRLTYPVDLVELEHLENPALVARTQALMDIVQGLAYYSADNFLHAREQFQAAVAVNGWFDSAGKEVAYLLIGNADVRYISKVSQKITAEDYQKYSQEAGQSYAHALEINPQYARAAVGQASVLFMRALGDPSEKSAHVDAAVLDQAEKAYQAALSLADAPPSANIPAKVHFGLGQIAFTRSQLLNVDSLAKAGDEFTQVVKEFDQGNSSVRDLASHALARLAWIATQKGDFPAAIQYARRSIAIASPYYQGRYQALLGDIYMAAKDPQNARAAYQLANEIASSNGDEDTVNQTAQILKSMK
jgi:tetratricopeptide (TPR) repeat protein